MTNCIKHIFAAGILFIFTAVGYAGEDEIYTSFFSNTGAGGYDVVAYFTAGQAVKGDDDFSVKYKNADWYFSSQENLDKFRHSPEFYAPQYGGYCAWAVANGYTASGDPLQWTLHDDKLYLNYDAKVRHRWTADKHNLIVLGDKNWPSVLN